MITLATCIKLYPKGLAVVWREVQRKWVNVGSLIHTSDASASAAESTQVPFTEIGKSMEAPYLCVVGAGN